MVAKKAVPTAKAPERPSRSKRECPSYHESGQRCTAGYGHRSLKHTYTIEWTDDEAATPEQLAISALMSTSSSAGPAERMLPEQFWPKEGAVLDPGAEAAFNILTDGEVIKVTEGGTPIVRVPAGAIPDWNVPEPCAACTHSEELHPNGGACQSATPFIPGEDSCGCEAYI